MIRCNIWQSLKEFCTWGSVATQEKPLVPKVRILIIMLDYPRFLFQSSVSVEEYRLLENSLLGTDKYNYSGDYRNSRALIGRRMASYPAIITSPEDKFSKWPPRALSMRRNRKLIQLKKMLFRGMTFFKSKM